jgi:hypothetical protein
MTETDKQKTSRKTETRELKTRKRGWVPPSNLEAPEPPEGFHHRWVRAEYRGMADEKNIIGRIRSGYEFVKIDEYPDRLDLPSIVDGKYKGVIGVGGLLLARIPIEIAKARQKYYSDKAKDNDEAVKSDLLREQHPSMPISYDSRSSKSFGGK